MVLKKYKGEKKNEKGQDIYMDNQKGEQDRVYSRM